MAEINNKPALRFAGFTEAWEQRKVGELASDTFGGGTPTTSNADFWNGTIPWIQSSDLTEHQVFGVEPRKYISKAAVMSSATKIVPENSIAIITRVGVGKLAVMPFSYATSQDFLSLSKLNVDVQFCAYLLYKKLQSELNSVQGTSIKGITKDELLGKVVSVPESREQEAIGAFFRNIDNLITLHQRKYDNLKNVKKACLEKMFPKNGSNVPEIRFKGFTEAWEQRKLSEIADIIGGGTPSTSNPEYWDGDIDWYAPAEMEGQRYAVGSVKKITELGLQKSSAQILPAGRTVLFTSRAGIGKMAILQCSAATNQGFQSIVIKDNTNPYFIYSMGSEIKKKAEGIASGSTFLEISGKMLGNLEIAMPSSQEQDKIACYFEKMDDLITLHQRKLEKLKNLKKACLEKMFI
jgi:type I restriction enzyme S subunit